jgi:uncharacterized protein YegP (UPF0339 family)
MFLKIGSVFAAALVLGTVGCSAAGESVDGQAVEIASTSAHFETFVGKDGKTYFDLVAGNGQNVLRSQGYKSGSGARSGMASVVNNGPNPAMYLVKQATDGTYYFDLTAGNHQIIGTSEMYASKSDAKRGALTVQALTMLLGSKPEVTPAAHEARFEVFSGENKKFYFHLRARNGEIVLGSQGYTTKSSALSGIQSVKTNGVDDARWTVFEAIDGEFGIRLQAGNYRTIGMGELYTTESNANAGVDTIEGLLAANLPVVQ